MIRRTLTEADAKNPGIIAETITALWGRLTALEKSACSPASPAPSSSPTTSSSGSCLSSSCSSSTSSAVVVADPSALIRADPKRPGWLKDEMLPLPVGTERVRGDRWGYPRAYPVNRQWTEHSWSLESFLEGSDDAEDNGDTGEVYHVPQPQPEKAKEPEKMVRFCQIHQRQYTVGPTRMCPECDAACADFTTPVTPGEVLSITVDSLPEPKPIILPPAEIADDAKELGWTPESRVYRDNSNYDDGSTAIRVYPSQKIKWSDEERAFDSGESETDCLLQRDTLLPNRTITTESILGTESAAKAVEQGVADVVEGRTVPIAVYGYCPICGAIGVNRERRLNGCDQCEKGHLYPSKDAVPTKPKPNPAQHKLAAEAQEEGERAKASSTPSTPRRSAREVAVDDMVVQAIRGMCEDQHLGSHCPNGFVIVLRAWLERNGLSGPVNARIMQGNRDKYGVCNDFPMPPAAIERDREGR